MPASHLSACPVVPGPVLVGFSGGLDSTVLLHWLAHTPAVRAHGLRAIHVDHGLQHASPQWAAHCQHIAAQCGVPLTCVQVTIDRASGTGLEAAARTARRTAFAAALAPGEHLALAHHRDDQAETFLLRALRGSGVDGLTAMRALSPFGQHQIWRPLLDIPRSALHAYALQHGLRWIEDPTNADPALADRNFLRHQVLPLLQQRWPHATAALARSAQLATQASDALLEQDAQVLTRCQAGDGTLSIAALQALDAHQRARVLRLWVMRHGAPPLPAAGVTAIEHTVLIAAHDSQALFAWRDVRIQRWGEALYLLRGQPLLPLDWEHHWSGSSPLRLPDGGELRLLGTTGFDAPVRVRARRGGERLVLPGRTHSRAVKDLLREYGLPPWRRQQIPVLMDADGHILAVGDALCSGRLQAWLDARAATLQWRAGT